MNLILTCRCGNKFRVALEKDDQPVVCTGCGRTSTVSSPRKQSSPPDAPTADDEEIKLQELPFVRPAIEPFEDDDGTGYALDPNDGRAGPNVGPGMYGTVANIPIDENAHAIAYGANGAWAIASQGCDVLIVDMKKRRKLDYVEEHDGRVNALALSATELLALSGDDEGEIRLWDPATGKCRIKLRAHRDPVNCVALSPDGQLALTGGADGRVKLWQLDKGGKRELEYADWSSGDEEITYATFTRDGTRLLAGSSEGRVSMWDSATGARLCRYDGLELPVSCVRLSDEGGIVTGVTEPVAHQGDSYLVICHWDANTGKPQRDFHIAVQSTRCCIAPDRNGKRLVVASSSKGPWMRVFHLDDGRCQYDYDHLRGTPICLAVSPLNNHVLASLNTRCLQVFGMETS